MTDAVRRNVFGARLDILHMLTHSPPKLDEVLPRLLAGTVGGLVQDALSSGILGMGGLTKTLVGFLVGHFGTQFIVTATVPRVLVFAAASAVHAGLFMGAYTLLELRSFPNPFPAVALQAVGNGVLGVVGFQVAEWLPQMLERRRSGRGMRVKR